MNLLTDDIPRKPRLRAGMVGGGRGSFFASRHRTAMRLTNRFELVAGVFSSNRQTSIEAGEALGVAADRNYFSVSDMAATEAARDDAIEVAIIVTPNHLHFEPCKSFLEAGIPVICEKPLVHSSEQARELQHIAAANDTFFAVTYTYTGYPMVRDARARIRAGEIGQVRFMHVEYLLEWLVNDPSKLGKGGIWRGDPVKAGPTGALGDIGTHAFNILEFVSGLRCTALNANLLRTVDTFGLDDTDVIQLEFEGNANGLLWSSLAAPGHRNGLRFKIVGSKATLEWRQEAPETLTMFRLGESDLTYRRGHADISPDAKLATSLPAGSPEGYLEALAVLYDDYANALEAGPNWRGALPVPVADIYEGLRGVLLSEISIRSSASKSWVPFPSS
ncbi:Gfo/Idh/MocA family oxidoreductase [Mesorhizobium sp. M4A.F.Ca.ET.022.05.2.1]|uniref:Gfo/Idh/MocA family protein n=1 Tax=Mesorhizobium sp. M4A.F.Ca.ET.022.05.2.1 TaxID=2496653 RepID=UPI000FCC446F|nr:Gfo/Idh/MocA family oxidoreductase [Mesorhizobium sp. M4A.F.Ca.ET.022.05.2.1]RVC82019.1 Gfo/Idh/MocA family oxidoreductase [Mesorhizobium sp. M4A.F.Ca.ET.022.05.2.1]